MTNNFFEPQEQSEEDILNNHFRNNLMDIYTCMPAFVTEYDSSKQMASVQPIFKQVFNSIDDKDISQARPIINNVPIMHLNVSDFYISLPVKKDDKVLLFFSQRSIDKYLFSEGKEVIELEEHDSRIFDINDCFAIPAVITMKTPLPNHADDLAIGLKDGNALFTVKKDKTIEIKADKVSTITSHTGIGAVSASTAVARGDKTDSNFSGLSPWLTAVTAILVPFGLALPAPTFNTTSSGKLFTND